MSKIANIYARVDPKIKEQAEAVLSQLGISMATAMEIYLIQIALQRKIPFDIALPEVRSIAFGALSDDEFNVLMDQSIKQYDAGNCTSVSEFEVELNKEFGI